VNTNDTIFNLVEFVDNDAFTNFESVLVQLSPKEAVIVTPTPSQGDDGKKIELVKTVMFDMLMTF